MSAYRNVDHYDAGATRETRFETTRETRSDIAQGVAALIDPARIVPALRVTSKRQALRALAERAAAAIGQPEQAIFDLLLERERLGTTGVGNGVAIPHGRLPGLDRPYGLVARLETPIEFESIDGQPVDLIFLLLMPDVGGADHLRTLARVSRLLRDRTVREMMRGAGGADALYVVLTSGADRLWP